MGGKGLWNLDEEVPFCFAWSTVLDTNVVVVIGELRSQELLHAAGELPLMDVRGNAKDDQYLCNRRQMGSR